MILKPSPQSSSRFFFNKETNTFVAEISELGRSFDLGRVYDDACDIGFTIISEKTGNPAVFALSNTNQSEGGYDSWDFICVTPGLKNLKAVIFND